MIPARILVLGSGGREHALAWRLARDAHAPRVMVAPGNDGMARSFPRSDVQLDDPAALRSLCARERVDLVVIGPEGPLTAGLADTLREAGLAVFGPSRACARLEASKWVAKEVMAAAGVPTARARTFDRAADAVAALAEFDPPWVIKADGLAAGKGVRVTGDRVDAVDFVHDCLEGGRFGASGNRVVLEEFLAGEELSVFAVCDGATALLLPAARDHKRAFDGDVGPNTGGMGAFAPVATVDDALLARVDAEVVRPVLAELARRGTPYRGLLYCGLMVLDGAPRVVEFNVRFGDPETQAVVPLVEGSFSGLLAAAAAGALEPGAVRVRPGAAVTVALTDAGYPESLVGGGVLEGLDAVEDSEDVTVFHAGTALEDGVWRVRGGRAAYVTAVAGDVASARALAYHAVGRLGGEGWRCRSDIARGAGDAATTGGTRARGGR